MPALHRLPHRLDPETGVCRAVIETPRGRRSKYDFDPETGAFELAGLLPEGMAFPLDFGFIPSTRAEDGDPLDVLVLFDEPCAVGAVLSVRLIGVIEADQTEHGNTVRNDRLIAAACASRLYAPVREAADLGDDYLRHLQAFWTQYNALKDKRFDVRAVRGREAAVAAVRRTELDASAA